MGPVILMQCVTPAPKFPSRSLLRNLGAVLCDQTAPAGSDNAPNVWQCCRRTAARKNRPERQTMAFGENDFLIEAYATDMTDKLAIVKEFSCGASRRARVLFVWASQLNVLFVLVSVLTVMFTQHSLPSSESLSNTNNTLLLPRYQHNKCFFSWRWKAILSKGLIFFLYIFVSHQNCNRFFRTT